MNLFIQRSEPRSQRRLFYLLLLPLMLTAPPTVAASSSLRTVNDQPANSANLNSANLNSANLHQANLRQANLHQANTAAPAATAASLDQLGQEHYVQGDFATAVQLFQQAAIAHERQGDRLHQALSLSNRSLAQQQLGDWSAATQAIATSLRLLTEQLPASPQRAQALAQVLSIQGHLQLAQGQAQLALESWEQAIALQPTRRHDTGTAPETPSPAVQEQAQQWRAEQRINQAQALQFLGLYRRAITTLAEVLNLQPALLETPGQLQAELAGRSPSPTAIAALQSLGESLRTTGNLEAAEIVLQQSLRLANQGQNPGAIAIAQFKLGNLRRAQALAQLNTHGLSLTKAVERINQAKQGRRFRDTELALAFEQQVNQALNFYQQAEAGMPPGSQQLQLHLNQLSLLLETQQLTQVPALIPPIQAALEQLAPSRVRVDAQINFAQSLMRLSPEGSSLGFTPGTAPRGNPAKIPALLMAAATEAQTLGYQRGQSYALGSLGRWYAQTEQRSAAAASLQRALVLAQSMQAAEIAYQWQWQLGRLAKHAWATSGDWVEHERAIAYYQEAVTTLQSVRRELVASPLDEQFSFRETIEPIHRELVELLLDGPEAQLPTESLQTKALLTEPSPSSPLSAPHLTRSRLNLARNVIESLQLTELVNFFREDCLVAKPEQIDQVDQTAAVIYPIVLPQRLAVIVSLPGQPLTYYTTPLSEQVSGERIDQMASQIQAALRQGNIPESEFLPQAELLYDWLIRPIRAQLEAKQIKTLVFVPDGGLRNIPMSVLRDRSQQQYLIQQYSLALTPGLQLLGSKPLSHGRLQALGGGLTSARGGYAALPNVAAELQQVLSTLPNSRVRLDDQFTNQGVQTEIRGNPFPIVHLATHGQFSSQLENTFILTWDGRLSVNQLTAVLQNRDLQQQTTLELLVLSACETAAGDSRAALGLAGFAVRAGARSTVGTLWQVNDASSSVLMSQFYTQLTQPQRTKAEALRRAQLHLLENQTNPKYQRPYYWAPYVLVGNWQ